MPISVTVPGVVAVDLDLLYRADEPLDRQEVLTAEPARRNGGGILPAQLLLLYQAGIALGEMPS